MLTMPNKSSVNCKIADVYAAGWTQVSGTGNGISSASCRVVLGNGAGSMRANEAMYCVNSSKLTLPLWSAKVKHANRSHDHKLIYLVIFDLSACGGRGGSWASSAGRAFNRTISYHRLWDKHSHAQCCHSLLWIRT
jgi:hypothetical protein